MKIFLSMALIIFAAWLFYTNKQVVNSAKPQAALTIKPAAIKIPVKAVPQSTMFSCDTRQHCSQMTSCAEAIYFIKHCDNSKMDGDSDGIPCERQWC